MAAASDKLERMLNHGPRAAEGRDLALTLAELGLVPGMAGPAVDGHARPGRLRLPAGGLAETPDAIPGALGVVPR